MAGRSGTVKVVIAFDDKGLTTGTRKAEKDLDRFEKSGKKSLENVGKAAKLAGAALAAGVAVAAKEAAEAAIEAEKTQAKLEAQLKASGISSAKYGKQIESVIQSQSLMSGLDDEDLTESFVNLVRVTGDVNKSLDLNVIALDFARAKNMDVAKAGELVGKVAGGNVGILGRYGIQVEKGASATEALGLLQKKFSGQAETYGKTTAGAADRAKVALENAGEALGAKLTPLVASAATEFAELITQMETGEGTGGKIVSVAESIGGAIGDAAGMVIGLVNAFKRGDTAAVALVATMAGLAAGFAAFKVIGVAQAGLAAWRATSVGAALATGGLTGAMHALKVAVLANPVGIAVAAIAALGVGLVIAYKKSETFRDVVKAAFNIVRKVAGTMFDVITFGLRQFLVGVSKVAGAVSKVPGMGWLKGVSKAAEAAAAELKEISDRIKGIPDKKEFSMTVRVRSSREIADAAANIIESGRNAPARRGAGRAMGGLIPGVGRGDTVPAMLEPGEFVIQRKIVERFGPTFFAALNEGKAPQFKTGGGIISRANKLDRMGIPYLYGGGHGTRDGFNRGGMDCSASVSYALGISPRVSGALMGFGRPGPGSPNDTKVYANPGHVFAVFNGRGWGTSRENPGGGPGWLSYNHRSGFTIRHLDDGSQKGKGKGKGKGNPQERAEGGKVAAGGRGLAGGPAGMQRAPGSPASASGGSGGSSGPTGSPSQRALESGLASADLALAVAEGTSGADDDIKAMQSKRKAMQGRLATINVALKRGRLSRRRRVELITEKAGLLRDIQATGSSIGDLRPTPGQLAELGVATASLTPDVGDDYTAAGALFGVRERELQKAQKSKDPEKIMEAISNLKSAGDALKSAAEAVRDAWKEGVEERLAQLDAEAVQARVNTPGDLADDLRVLNDQLGLNMAAFQAAEARGDAEGIVKFGNAVLSARDAIEQMTAAAQDQSAQTERLLGLERQRSENLARELATSQAQYGTLEQALLALISRGQGARTGLALQAAGGSGVVAAGMGRP